ncbi:MAG: transglycosylase SLT domain-containing protein [Gammaproteobacteria bacterium]|nr:MAG: transglycosylase SLT domain-containing protein [Gammaproteobacteria bacterium]
MHRLVLSMKHISHINIRGSRQLIILLALYWSVCGQAAVSGNATDSVREQFRTAWDAARQGDHETFGQIKQNLQGYVLYPYLQYEDYRNRRATVAADEMAAFLETHENWAFTDGLRRAWLKSVAKKGRWADLVAHSEGVSDTVLRCQRARGQIILQQTDGLLAEAQSLWAVGKSQPDECDPLFAWLVKNDGIPVGLAWERIRLAFEAGNPRLTIYLARYLPKNERRWLKDWQKLSQTGYSRLERARRWPDNEITRMITAASLRQLARKDTLMAAEKFQALDGQFKWGDARRATLLRDIALYSAMALDKQTVVQMQRVPVVYRDSQLLEWWSRFLLSVGDWSGLASVIKQMPEDTRNHDRWRYWLAQAELRTGQAKKSSATPSSARALLRNLAKQANYYGFLAADELGLKYNICPLEPAIDVVEIDRIGEMDGFRRALELRKAELDNWAIQEWSLAIRKLPVQDLKVAAALAHGKGWYDRAIVALGNSGDLRFYAWRFPLLWENEVKRYARANQLDPAWVYGTIRSESAMLETARSPANALGLMQLTPATGKRVAKKHGIRWSGNAGLQTVAGNLPVGTAYLGDLLQDFRRNPVLVSGAYNAGPTVVKRWLKNRPASEAAIWIETLPFFETRDYIPRVLAFTTIYDWRMGGEVKRISARMPDIDSGKISVRGSTGVVCNEQDSQRGY